MRNLTLTLAAALAFALPAAAQSPAPSVTGHPGNPTTTNAWVPDASSNRPTVDQHGFDGKPHPDANRNSAEDNADVHDNALDPNADKVAKHKAKKKVVKKDTPAPSPAQ